MGDVVGLGLEALAWQRAARRGAGRVAGRQRDPGTTGEHLLQPQVAVITARDISARHRPQRPQQRPEVTRGPEILAADLDRAPSPGVEVKDRGQLVARMRRPSLPRLECGRSRGPGPGDEEVRSARRQRVHAERELRHDPEVAPATTAQGPQQIRVGVLVDRAQPAVGSDDLGSDQVVDGEPERPRRQPHTAAQGHAGNAHRGAGARRDGGAVGGEAGVDVDQLGTSTDRRGLGVVVDRDAVHLAQIEHDAAGDRRVALVAVAPRPSSEWHAVGDRPAHCTLHVGGVNRARNRARHHIVEALVVDKPGAGISGLTLLEHMPAHRLLEPAWNRRRGSDPRLPRGAAGQRQRETRGARGGQKRSPIDWLRQAFPVAALRHRRHSLSQPAAVRWRWRRGRHWPPALRAGLDGRFHDLACRMNPDDRPPGRRDGGFGSW